LMAVLTNSRDNCFCFCSARSFCCSVRFTSPPLSDTRNSGRLTVAAEFGRKSWIIHIFLACTTRKSAAECYKICAKLTTFYNA
jgi:hypothetical protein